MVRIRHKVGQRGLRATQHGRRWWTWSWRRSRVFLRLWTLGWLGGVYTCVLVYTCVHLCAIVLTAGATGCCMQVYTPLYNLQVLLVNMNKKTLKRKINRSSEGRPIHSVSVGGKDKEEGGARLVWIFWIFYIISIFCLFCIYRWSLCLDILHILYTLYILDIGGHLVWIICGLHAREWVSVLACIHILQALIQVKQSYFLA